tara:strand:- start:145 stop:405 length:261 start_codon:yes stop_codon:yes gene_type:complete
MLLIIKNKLDTNPNLENYKEILLIDDGIYNILNSNFNENNININILKNDLDSRGIILSTEQQNVITLMNYEQFVELTVNYYPIYFI